MKERSNLKEKLKSSSNQEKIEEEIVAIEKKLVEEIAEENRNKVVRNFKTLAETDGTTNTNGMWQLKKKIFPKPYLQQKRIPEGTLYLARGN